MLSHVKTCVARPCILTWKHYDGLRHFVVDAKEQPTVIKHQEGKYC